MDRRIEKTRQLIMNAFMKLLKEKGIEKLTIRDISELANVNRGTIYLHYTDKYDILDQCIENYVNELIAHCQKDAPIQLREAAFLNVFTYLEENMGLYKLLYKNDKSGIFHNRLNEVLSKQVETAMEMFPEGLANSGEVAAQFLVNGFLGVMEWWLNHPVQSSPQEITTQLLSFLEPYTRYMN